DFCTAADAEPIWVCPAGIDPGEAEEMASVFSFLGIERLLITRVDTARRLGSILSAALSQGYGLCNAANTSQVTGELKPLDATLLADMLIRFKRERMGI
ncbi:MAG: GTPase, partial [Rickettsiales bacterium]|nr:GTPase [Rickettsiales bacterium]